MAEPNGLLDLVEERDAAVARVGELVLERDRLDRELLDTRKRLAVVEEERDSYRDRDGLVRKLVAKNERIVTLTEALQLFVDLDWHRLTSYSKDYLEGRFSAEIMDRARAALRGGTHG